MGIRAVVFDMDGTLLHTMPDLTCAANRAFAQMGLVERTEGELLAHMGLGGRQLIERVVGEGVPPECRQRAFELWRELYIGSDYSLTRPFDGMVEAVRDIRELGVKTAVLSNKFDAGVRRLADIHFPGLFDAVRGDAPPMPPKPDATALLAMLAELGARPDEAAYVGDTIADVLLSRNAGVKCVGVSWGYDSAAPLPHGELDFCAHAPADIVAWCRMCHQTPGT